MHGIIGQLAADPVRLAIAIMAVIAAIAIIRCLSGLALFDSGPGQADRRSGSPAKRTATPIDD